MQPKPLIHLSDIAPKYSCILMDLWGVIHDGTQLYPGAMECLKQLKAAGKKVVCVSNAPRRAAKAVAVLDQLGVPRDFYQTVMTSGETAYRELEAGKVMPGIRYFFIGPARDADVLQGLHFQAVDRVAMADFLLNAGFGSEQDEAEEVSDALLEASTRLLPMVCLNPDLEVIKITGERYACAGVIARQYEEMGGEVIWYGKPYSAIYKLCLKELGHPDPRDVLAIGDGLHTDIAGALGMGMDCVLVTGGILSGKTVTFERDNAPTFTALTLRW